MQLLKTVGIAAAASLALGCDQRPDVGDLSPDNQELVNAYVDDAVASEGVVKNLIDAAKPLFDARGDEGDSEQLKIDIETVTETLVDFRDHGQIYQFDSRTLTPNEVEGHTADSVAFQHYSSLKPKTLVDNYIALDIADENVWCAGVLAHEAGHAYGKDGKHDSAIKQAVAANVSPADLLEVTLEEHDIAYLLSALYTVSDSALRQYRFDVSSQTNYIRGEYEAGRMTADQADAEIEERLDFSTEAWIADNSATIFSNFADQLSVLDVDQAEMTAALADPAFQKRLENIRSEAQQEILAEIKGEVKAEIKQAVPTDIPRENGRARL